MHFIFIDDPALQLYSSAANKILIIPSSLANKSSLSCSVGVALRGVAVMPNAMHCRIVYGGCS